MSNSVFIATSLDGFIAGRDDDMTWLDEIEQIEGEDFGFGAFTERIDATVMGRRTFETVLGFGEWPYLKPVFVVSASLDAVPADLSDRVQITSITDPVELTAHLVSRGLNDLYIDGGRLITSFLEADAIDEMIITRVPVILGGGVPLFGALDHVIRLEHQHTTSFANGLVTSTYRTAA